MKRLIFHVDVNSAFLSWEAVRRVKEGLPDLREIPSCVGGDPDKRTSIVLAKSIPAKKYGVQTGEALATALRKCPKLVVAPPDFRLYSHNSKAFKDICRQFAPVVEEFSIDRGIKYPHIYNNPEETFRAKVEEAIQNHPYALKNHSEEELRKVVDEEFEVYKATKSIDFMLMQTYLREWEKEKGIQSGYGRGSVSGSMIAYLLGVTQMDSMRFGLNFFRFLNPVIVFRGQFLCLLPGLCEPGPSESDV